MRHACPGWTLRALLLFLFAVLPAFAQDPTKVEPTHYKIAFENDTVQVVDIHYGPHEKSRLHAHPGGVVVVLTEAHLRFTDENGKTQEIHPKPGESRWFPPFKHQVENLGDTTYNAVFIGIKNHHPGGQASLKNVPSTMDEATAKLIAQALMSAPKR